MSKLSYTHINSPVGSLMVAGDDDALHYLCFPNSPNAITPRSDWHQTDAPFLEVRRQLTAYFNGELRQFDLPLFLTGTVFQKAFGDTCPLYLLERRRLMASWRPLSNAPKQVAQWVLQMELTRLRSSCHVTE